MKPFNSMSLVGRIAPSRPYGDLSTLIARLSNKQAGNCTVITFNYDLAVDVALHNAGLNPDYGLTENAIGAVKLFKLHGSVGWHRCSMCKKILTTTLPTSGLLHNHNTVEMKWSDLNKYLGSPTVCCGNPVGDDSVIVPPSWGKAEYRSDLVNVWRRAAIELKDATSIFVCGYSLPPTDSFFQYLYGLGTVGGEPLERFWVFDPAEVHRKFRDLLGPGARARFAYHPLVFEKAVAQMSSALK